MKIPTLSGQQVAPPVKTMPRISGMENVGDRALSMASQQLGRIVGEFKAAQARTEYIAGRTETTRAYNDFMLNLPPDQYTEYPEMFDKEHIRIRDSVGKTFKSRDAKKEWEGWFEQETERYRFNVMTAQMDKQIRHGKTVVQEGLDEAVQASSPDAAREAVNDLLFGAVKDGILAEDVALAERDRRFHEIAMNDAMQKARAICFGGDGYEAAVLFVNDPTQTPELSQGERNSVLNNVHTEYGLTVSRQKAALEANQQQTYREAALAFDKGELTLDTFYKDYAPNMADGDFTRVLDWLRAQAEDAQNGEDNRFLVTDPEVKAGVEILERDPRVGNEQLKEIIADRHGDGLSTSDYATLTDEVDKRKPSMALATAADMFSQAVGNGDITATQASSLNKLLMASVDAEQIKEADVLDRAGALLEQHVKAGIVDKLFNDRGIVNPPGSAQDFTVWSGAPPTHTATVGGRLAFSPDGGVSWYSWEPGGRLGWLNPPNWDMWDKERDKWIKAKR